MIGTAAACGSASDLLGDGDASVRPKSNQRPRTIRSFNARLNSFAQKGNFNEILALIDSVHNGQLELSDPLNTYSYTILVKAYCNAGSLKAARELLREMETFDENQRPNRFTYNTLLNGCVRWNHMSTATELFNVMKSSNDMNLQPDHVTFTTLIKGLASNGDMDAAEELLKMLQNHQDPRCRPNHVTYNTMIKGYTSCGDMESAERIMNEMRRQIDPVSRKQGTFPSH